MTKLTRKFYQHANVVTIANKLVGKYLCVDGKDGYTEGKIVETEAYSGRNDLACHASSGKSTKRTEIMYGEGGFVYTYLCYGIHTLFNVVTNVQGLADAVLIRAIEPTAGIELIRQRRGFNHTIPALGSGPGKVSQALGIDLQHYGEDLTNDIIWIEDRQEKTEEIISSPRIGVDYAGEDARLPWRFYIKDSRFISKP